MSKRAQVRSLSITGGHLIDPATGVDEPRDLLVEDGLVAAIEKPGALANADVAQTIDASGLFIAPGFIDIHVHLREPGFSEKETIETGCAAAAAGGFTGICCMPNTKPVNDSVLVTEHILHEARRVGLSRVYPIGAVTTGLTGESLAPMRALREAGCIAFSNDGLPVGSASAMRRALEYSLTMDAVISCHEEELCLSRGFSMNESALSLKLGLMGMPAAAENIMISRDIELAELTGARVHFCHVSSARGVKLVERAKQDGINVTAEVTPHHLCLDERAVEEYDTAAKMSPPLRSEADLQALQDGLARGVLDCIATDHAPHEDASKNVVFPEAACGIIGLQTALPISLALVEQGALSLSRAIEAMTKSPADCFGFDSGTLRKGAAADIVVFDKNAQYVFDQQLNYSKSVNSPFLGKELKGRVVKTILAGQVVFSLES